jgi:TolB-like protein/Tfp pilus assembly protein PilF/tRNA A-37 threonylcarbamoyl transferase component Bud32
MALMDRDWRMLGPLLDRALELPPEEQATWLAELRARSPELAVELTSLLAREDALNRQGFLAAPPAAPPNVQPTALHLGAHYAVERELGRGGMATVYLAEDLKHRRKVAIKVLHAELSATLGAERFLKEIELTASLQHPHILPLFDSGSAGGLLYYVMPYVDGETLRARLTRERQLSVDEAVRLASEVADALGYAHTRGVVHRDVKPENILLQGGHALVADFGIALAVAQAGGERLTRTGVLLGTPQYMAPEQVTGEPNVDARADVYALGAVLYEMLAGEAPFSGPTAQAVLAQVATAEPKPLTAQRRSVPPHVDAVVRTALEKLPADRFATAAAFAAALAAPSADWRGRMSVRARLRTLHSDGMSRRARVTTWIAMAPIILLVALLGLNVGGLRDRVSRRLGASQAGAAGEQRSVAVLPFENVGGNPANEYFSDGLSEELIAALSQLRSVRVAARTSAFAFKGQARDIREIGRALSVATVLVGSVRKAENRVRVTAQLIDASNGFDLWSATYEERQLSDIFEIQADLALRIARALEANLTPTERSRLARRPTENVEAYTLYLKGRFAWSQRGEGLANSIEYFKQAIAVDPQYARAYAGLASAYEPLGLHGYIHPREARERAREAAGRAVKLDDGLAEAHTARAAYLHVYEWDWPAAEREFRRAIELDPNDPTAHNWYGFFLGGMGRFDEAIVETTRGRDLDPLAPDVGLAAALRKAGRYDLARAAYGVVIEHHPGYWQAHEGLARLFEATGELKEAVPAFERAMALAGRTSRPKAGLARVLALSGRKADARRLIGELRGETGRTGIYDPVVATALVAAGDTNAAIEWLETSYRQRHPDLAEVNVDPRYAALRSDPRFVDLLRRVGFRP